MAVGFGIEELAADVQKDLRAALQQAKRGVAIVCSQLRRAANPALLLACASRIQPIFYSNASVLFPVLICKHDEQHSKSSKIIAKS